MKYLKAIITLFREAGESWGRDKAPILAAALAYYTIFSLAPLLVISVAVAGFFFGDAAVQGQIVGQIEGVVGREIAITVERIIENAASVRTSGVLATVASVGLLFVGASGVFGQLKTALNMIWGISPKPGQGVIAVIKTRLLAFMMVVGIGVLLFLLVALNIVIVTLRRYLTSLAPPLVNNLPRLDIIVALVIITALFAVIFRILPDAEVAWRDVWLGALVTALLFGLGNYLIGLYLSRSSVGSAYGAAGSLAVFLTWIYYSALILMFGAEFTQVYANKYGSKIRPSETARLVARSPIESQPATKRSPSTRPARVSSVSDEPTISQRQIANQIAAALLGMALGLLLAFVAGLRRN